MGMAEIADLLGVSRQRAHKITQRDDFPAPVAKLAAGTIWKRGDVERWLAKHRPG